MHPAGAVAAAGAPGGAAMDVRVAARASIILGLAMALIAFVAATTISPGDFPLPAQVVSRIEHAAPAPAPSPGAAQAQANQCAATEAEALDLREEALSLVLGGVAQAVTAAAADVALAGSLPVGRVFGAIAHLIGAISAWSLCFVVRAAATVAIGHCAAAGGLVLGYALLALSYSSLIAVSLAVTCC